jgi:hypothetical protein
VPDQLKQSEAIDQLAAALSLAQGEIEDAAKDSVNPHFKSRYADLASVRAAIRGPFAAHGLAVTQFPIETASGGLGLATMLLHKSGQWLCGITPLVGRLDQPQAVGSALTYARRYGLSAVTGVATDDDDGEATRTADRAPREHAPSVPFEPRPAPKREAATDVRPLSKLLNDRINAKNDEWARIERRDNIPNNHQRLVTNIDRAVQALTTMAVKAEAIPLTEVERPETGKRDPILCRQALARLMAREPEWVGKALDAYLAKKWEEARQAVAHLTADPDVDYPPEPGMAG